MRKAIAVIFDFGNVLATFDKNKVYRHLAEHSWRSAHKIGEAIAAIERDYESGNVGDEHFIELIRSLTAPNAFADADIRRICGNIFIPAPSILPIVKALMAKGVPIAVLSNTCGIHWPFISDLPVIRELRRYGATFVLSYQLKAFKPDARMYEAALQGLSLTDPADALFLDDAPENVEGARAYGCRAEVFDCRVSHSAEKLIAILSAYGLSV